MNDFVTDDEWQRQMRNEFLVPFYKKTFLGYVLLDKRRFAKRQQERGVDTIAWYAEDQPIGIEEKIVRWAGYVYTAVCLEIASCTVPGYIAPGWMWYSEADILVYCMQLENGDLDCRTIDFPELHKWFWDHEREFPFHVMPDKNKTACRVVPIERIEPFIRKRFTLTRQKEAAAA
jgi:hypothetical protein